MQVKELREVRGVWRFHLTRESRVFYVVSGTVLVVVMIERSPGVTGRTLKELRRRKEG